MSEASWLVPRGSVPLRVCTYNIHRCRGMDRLTRPERIAAVLATVNADIVALQEVIGPGLTPGHAEALGAALGMGWMMAPTRELRRHQFGNVILSRFPIREHAQIDLSWKTCEARAAQRASIDLGDAGVLHVYNAHLGTALLERRYQAPRLADWVTDRRISGSRILLGDFNEWGRGLVADILAQRLNSVDIYPHLKRRRTYPGFFPVLHLDHIYFSGNIAVERIELPRTRLALVASDHLPLVADLRVWPDTRKRAETR